MARLAVLGAGAMGLAAAYHAARAGHDVTVFEADRVPGGMAAHFDFDGLSIERFYHFICRSDQATFELCEELGIGEKLKWRETSMGYFFQGEHHPWGDPVSLLRFPHLSLPARLRYGLQMFLASKRRDWTPLDGVSAKDWFIRAGGQEAWDVLWERLFTLKFHEYTDQVSAAWIWSRIKRIGTSRKSLFQEELGYLEGGSESLVDALVQALEKLGVPLRLGEPAEEIVAADGVVQGVRTREGLFPAERVISTVPTPWIPDLVPAFREETRERYRAIANVGVVCVLLKLRRSVTPHFWLNVVDEAMEIPGLVEFSNLRPLPETVVYVPYYMPTSKPKFAMADERFVAECLAYVRRINPDIGEGDLLASKVGRLRYAQPVCDVGFMHKLPPVQTEIEGLQIADTCFYYPEDRGISESVRLGREMAERA